MIAAPTTWISGTILTTLTIIAKSVDKNKVGKIQDAVNDLVAKSKVRKFLLNERKLKEIRTSFARTDPTFWTFSPVILNEKAIDDVSTVKLLDL